MRDSVRRTAVVARRVGLQLLRDRRFLALSLLAPTGIVYLLRVFLDAFDSPLFDARSYVFPAGAFIIHFIAYILCAVALVRERTSQTLARMFVMGYRRSEIVAGYLLAYGVLATVQASAVLFELKSLFDLHYPASSMGAIYCVLCILAVTSIALGILASNFARTEAQILPFIPLVVIPSIFLSGLLIPVAALPAWARASSRLIPLYYGADAIRAFLESSSSQAGWQTVGELAVYGVIVLSSAMVTLREHDR